MPIAVHPGRDQGVHVDHPAALADLEHQRVRRDERVRAGVQRPRPELATCVSSSWAMVETWDFNSRVMPRVSTSFSIRRVETPSR